MKVIAWILAVLGLLGLVAGIGLGLYNQLVPLQNIYVLASTVNRNGDNVVLTDPRPMVLLQTGLALVGGLLLGLGLGMPKKTRGWIRDDAVNEYKRSLAADATKTRTVDAEKHTETA